MRVPLAHQTFVVVDLETTGGSAVFDRITEVAALRVRNGEVVDRFETLVDPGVPITPFIARLTGISNALVKGQPRIEQVLPALHAFIGGAPVVAHNASFDHGFLSSAFQRVGIDWSAERVCTLRLARRLMPGLPTYKLDSLCAHLGFAYVQHHRAGPDAEVTVSLLHHLLGLAAEKGVAFLPDLLDLQERSVSHYKRKGKVDEAQVASLPTGPGVYLLKDASGHVVYVGKSINVRQRVRQHLRPSGTAQSPNQPRLRKRLRQVAQVEGIETGSELGALFLESKLVKRYLPDGNAMLRDYRNYPFVKLDCRDAFPRLEATRERPDDGATYFGPFRHASTVARAVLFLNEELGLRQCKGQLVPGGSACPLLEMGKCLGPCVGAVAEADYAHAVETAQRVLRGEDTAVLERAAARRDQLAEDLRFEEAIELRDRIRDLEAVIRVVQRLRAFADRNLVIVAPDVQPNSARLFMIRAGRLAHELSVPVRAEPRVLRSALKQVFSTQPCGPVSRDEVDDMMILDSWLRLKKDAAHEVPVPFEAPEQALPALRQSLRAVGGAAAA